YAMGLLQSGAVAGTIFGPFLGGILAEFLTFHQVFWITSVVIGIVTISVIFFVKEQFVKLTDKTKISFKGGMTMILQTQPLPALFTIGFLIQFSLMSAQPQMSLYVQEIHPSGQYIAFFAGLVPAVTGVANMLASPWLGRLGDNKGSQYVLFYSMIGATVFLIPQAFVHSIGGLLFFRFMFGLAIGGLLPSVNALIRQSAPKGKESATYGYSNSALFLGNMIGPILGGFLASFTSIRVVLLLGAVLFLMSTIWMKHVFENKVEEGKRLLLKRNMLPK
ncbi:MAG: MFS transporter, partial [Bacilli bacterium]